MLKFKFFLYWLNCKEEVLHKELEMWVTQKQEQSTDFPSPILIPRAQLSCDIRKKEQPQQSQAYVKIPTPVNNGHCVLPKQGVFFRNSISWQQPELKNQRSQKQNKKTKKTKKQKKHQTKKTPPRIFLNKELESFNNLPSFLYLLHF